MITLQEHIHDEFPHAPTADQQQAIAVLGELERHQPDRVVLIRGYAGTGKTTLLGAFVKALARVGIGSVLMAPTGRAAKVMSGYSGKAAFTMHKKLYRRQKGRDERQYFALLKNEQKDTVFIVDEASMIPRRSGLASSSFEYRDLLEDLLEHVHSGERCQLVLIGDDAQLPPVNEGFSPALDAQYLERNYRISIEEVQLQEVLRQAFDSGILANATALRRRIGTEEGAPFFHLNGHKDMVRVTGETLQEELESAYGDHGAVDTMIVCRSNKRANLFNQQVRARILWMEEELNGGDLLMVVRNNYYWCKEDERIDFIANGDILEVQKILRRIDLYGFRFAEVLVQLVDHPDEPEFETIVMLDTLMIEAPSLPRTRMKELYYAVADDHEEPDRRKKHRKIMENPYFNALQIKFSYAVTCHKAQGGQWPVVYVDQGYLTEEMIDDEYLRWLYTALTRATEKLYLVNFHPRFFEGEEG